MSDIPGKIASTISLVVIAAVLSTTSFQSQAQQQAALVSVDKVIKQPFTQTIPIIGRLVARRAGTVAARTSGAVIKMLVAVGDSVTKDQVIAHLDTDTLSLQKRFTDAQLAESRARLKTAKAQRELARQEVQRLSRLKNSAATSKAAFEDATQQENIAIARVQEAESAVTTSQSSVKLAELNLSFAAIKAPYSGTITKRLTEIGSFVQTGQAVVNMVSDQVLELEADVPYDRLTGLSAGTEISFILDNDSHHYAIVRAIIPEENPRTRTRVVRFTPRLENNAGLLAVDQSATLMIPVGAERDILSVQKDAVIRLGEHSTVYVVNEEHAQPTSVLLGAAIGDRFEVIEGLDSGDVVVIRGNERLRPNQKVQLAESKAKSSSSLSE